MSKWTPYNLASALIAALTRLLLGCILRPDPNPECQLYGTQSHRLTP